MSQELLDALRRVRDGMLAGKYVHIRPEYPVKQMVTILVDRPKEQIASKRLFNMCWWVADTDCGTCGCIGGWVEVELGRVLTEEEDRTAYALFYSNISMDVTTRSAALAINKFLNGKEPWPMVRA